MEYIAGVCGSVIAVVVFLILIYSFVESEVHEIKRK